MYGSPTSTGTDATTSLSPESSSSPSTGAAGRDLRRPRGGRDRRPPAGRGRRRDRRRNRRRTPGRRDTRPLPNRLRARADPGRRLRRAVAASRATVYMTLVTRPPLVMSPARGGPTWWRPSTATCPARGCRSIPDRGRRPRRPVTYAAYDIPEPLALADLNGDGRRDVTTVHGGWQTFSVMLQQPVGRLGAATFYDLPHATHYRPAGPRRRRCDR
jgi:hypothetical protein